MSSSRVLSPWKREELERLITWMQENFESLRGKQVVWHKDVKDQVFSDDDHITVKKIGEKAQNMKKSWKDAKAMHTRSGWGIKAEDNELSINELLEKKCTFFWQLDEIWGSRPNATAVT
ncbi:hypothetical protein BDZ91DRAFT_464829 [Kalaharituber pfeilii]|nr:hypothetical protein BDZ91DRAFT_464829 [Kalaharituber pfeilii]